MRSSLLIGGSYDGEWLLVDDDQTELLLPPRIRAIPQREDADALARVHEHPVCIDAYYEFEFADGAVAPRLFRHASISHELAIYELMRGYRASTVWNENQDVAILR